MDNVNKFDQHLATILYQRGKSIIRRFSSFYRVWLWGNPTFCCVNQKIHDNLNNSE